LLEIKRSVIAAKLGIYGLLISFAVAMVLAFSGCGEYGHIPLAGNQNTAETVETVRVILQWNNVPDAASYNVYWSRFPGVTKHNGQKIANVKTLTR